MASKQTGASRTRPQQQRATQKRQAWRQTVRRWRASGESVRAFCRREGISEPSFYWWRRRLSGQRSAGSASKASARGQGPHVSGKERGKRSTPEAARAPQTGFAEVQLSGADATGGEVIELVLSTGERLRIGPAVHTDHLQRVLAVLQGSRAGVFDASGDESC